MKYIFLLRSIKNNAQLNIEYIYLSHANPGPKRGRYWGGGGGGGGGGGAGLELTYSENRVGHSENYGNNS
jgi:hypothetical protein